MFDAFLIDSNKADVLPLDVKLKTIVTLHYILLNK